MQHIHTIITQLNDLSRLCSGYIAAAFVDGMPMGYEDRLMSEYFSGFIHGSHVFDRREAWGNMQVVQLLFVQLTR